MPAQVKKRWPAEWEPHKATWMAWPCRSEIWLHGLEKAQLAFADVANAISESESVKMLVRPEHTALARKTLSSNVELIEYLLDDSWARDICPLWITNNGQAEALSFTFNAWGEKFTPYGHDAKVADFIIQQTKSQSTDYDFVLEGGAIHGNGAGTLLTTEECLLNPNRNPDMNKSAIEGKLLSAFGAQEIIWLKRGLYGDEDTDGHIDNMACFVDSHTVLSQKVNQPTSENDAIYNENRSIIQRHGLELIELHEPEPRYLNGQRMPLSYINYYVANEQVIIPAFGCKQDDEAKSVIQDLFPQRSVTQLNADEITIGGGGIHCITMQQPAI